jgi:hypothetical protein
MPANTLPADFDFPEELPGDFAFPEEGFQGEVLQTIPAEVQPKSWVDAMFPRTARAEGAGATASGLALDLLSPGRFVAALARPEGESYRDAVARIAPPEVMEQPGGRIGNEFSDRLSETFLRDPSSIPLAGLTAMTGGAAAPAWLARMGWLGRGAVTGLGAGTTVAATNQAENLAAGRDLSARQALLDASIGTGFGIGGGLLGATGSAMQRLAVPAGMKLAKVPKAFREGVAEAFPEMLQRGVMRPTVKGIQKAAGKQEAQIGTLYAAGKAGTEGVPAVPLGMYADRAAKLSQSQADNANIRREIANDASEWIQEWGSGAKSAPGAASPGMVDVPTAINARSRARIEAGSYESQAPKSAIREARQDAADEFASGINSRLDVVAPGVREADKFAAPYFRFRPYLDALGVRGNNYEIGLTELGAGGLGGALGSAVGPGGTTAGMLGAALLARLQRSPALPYGLYRGGSLGQALSAPAIRAVPLAASATDNARGAR